VDGNRHGKGKVNFNNGGIYEGNFVNGLKEGQGKMYYPSGNFYEG
jgi:antitoxin component YwqK of YwqJK toxin-antitoxin module